MKQRKQVVINGGKTMYIIMLQADEMHTISHLSKYWFSYFRTHAACSTWLERFCPDTYTLAMSADNHLSPLQLMLSTEIMHIRIVLQLRFGVTEWPLAQALIRACALMACIRFRSLKVVLTSHICFTCTPCSFGCSQKNLQNISQLVLICCFASRWGHSV